MVVLALILINKAGGLVYNRTFAEGLNQLSTNDYLVLAGTFHGVHAITARLNPVKNRSSIQSQQFPSGGGVGPSVPPSQGLSAQPLPGQQQQHHQPGGPNQSAPLANPSAGAGAGAGAGGGGALADGNLLTRPEPSSGIEVMETENFRLQCFATQTGLKFLLFTDAVQASGPVADAAMRRIYEYYADYVMKNPFYQLEMPVRCEMFDRRLNSYIREINSSAR